MRFLPILRRDPAPSSRVDPELKAVAPTEVKADASTPSVATIAAPDAALFALFGGLPITSGITFTPEAAMRCTASRCAIQAIAETIAALPMRVFAIAADGTRERDLAHPVDRLVNLAPNGWMPAAEFREVLTRDCLLWGSGFAYINRAGDGRVLELQRLKPGRVSVAVDPDTEALSYIVGDQRIGAGDMLHLRAPYVYWPLQQSPTYDAREAIGLALVLEQHAAQLFARAARPSGILSLAGAATAATIANAKAAFSGAHAGRNTGGMAVVDGGAQFTPTTFTSVDSEFMAQRRFAIEEIARAYRVPPVLCMEYGRATWGNSEEMGRQFVNYTLVPWMRRWEAEIDLKLFSADEQARNVVEHDTDALLRADFVQRMEGNSKAIAARVMNPNEVRAREGLAPYAGGEAFINPAVQQVDVGR